ncbi:SagB/ThcOx family dehydrogenase [Stetteria hydrogenophila]
MAGVEERLRRLLGGRGFRLFLEGLRVAEETGDPAWLYHFLAALQPGYYGGSTRYPPPPGEYYKTLAGARVVELPEPRLESGVDALEAVRLRRSRRSYGGSLSLQDLGDVLYYSVGVTGRAWWGGPKRAYPSAGALQPLEAYVAARSVEGLEPGVYHYNPGEHALELVAPGDYSERLAWASLGQEHVGEAPAVIALTAVLPRTASKYGYRSYRYTHIDAGHAGENIYIAAEALGLATVAVGAFYDFELCKLLGADCRLELPMLLYPIGPRR